MQDYGMISTNLIIFACLPTQLRFLGVLFTHPRHAEVVHGQDEEAYLFGSLVVTRHLGFDRWIKYDTFHEGSSRYIFYWSHVKSMMRL